MKIIERYERQGYHWTAVIWDPRVLDVPVEVAEQQHRSLNSPAARALLKETVWRASLRLVALVDKDENSWRH